jgi:integrase/recombinase XerD
VSAVIVDAQTVHRFADNLRSRGKQPATIESYCRDAQRFLEYIGKVRLPAQKVEPETLLAYQDYLRNDCEERDNSVRRTVIGIRQFYRFLSESRTVAGTPFDAVPIPVRDESLPSKGIKDDDVDTILTIALAGKPECKALRDAAIVSLLAHEGVKANELINLLWTDVLEEEGTAGSLRIAGSRARAIPLSSETHEWLKAYRRAYEQIRHPVITGPVKKRIFISFKGRDAASPLPEMTRHGLKFILYELGEKAGVPGLNTEQLRHYAVSHLLAKGKAPDEIMVHLGLRRIGNIAKHLASKGGAKRAGASKSAT